MTVAVYKSPQADMGYDIVCGLFLPMYTDGFKAITMHSSFQTVDKIAESQCCHGPQRMLAIQQRIVRCDGYPRYISLRMGTSNVIFDDRLTIVRPTTRTLTRCMVVSRMLITSSASSKRET